MWQRWLVIGLVLLVIGVVIFEESTTPDKTLPPPPKESAQKTPSDPSEQDQSEHDHPEQGQPEQDQPEQGQSAYGEPEQDQSEQDHTDHPTPLASTDEPAVFLGAHGNIKAWLAQNLNYPQKAVEYGIEGKVYVRFTIDKNGYVKHPVIVKGAHPLLDKEVIRIIHTMPRWKPGKINGKPARSTFNLPVNFKLQ